MKIEIEIPKEFEADYLDDKFEDSLQRLAADIHLLAGNYEHEVAMMLIKAFKEAKSVEIKPITEYYVSPIGQGYGVQCKHNWFPTNDTLTHGYLYRCINCGATKVIPY